MRPTKTLSFILRRVWYPHGTRKDRRSRDIVAIIRYHPRCPSLPGKTTGNKLSRCHDLIQHAVVHRSIMQKKTQKPYYHIKMTKAAKANFNLWSTFLHKYNGRTFFHLDAVHTDEALQLYPDASGSIGSGAVLKNHWLHRTWPADWEGYDIIFLALYPIVLSTHLCGTLLSNRTIEFHTDNITLVSIINTTFSKKPHIMALVHSLVLSTTKFNFMFYAIHIPGVQNVHADILSRQQIGLVVERTPFSQRRSDYHPTI